jgi:hypothetical protein
VAGLLFSLQKNNHTTKSLFFLALVSLLVSYCDAQPLDLYFRRQEEIRQDLYFDPKSVFDSYERFSFYFLRHHLPGPAAGL